MELVINNRDKYFVDVSFNIPDHLIYYCLHLMYESGLMKQSFHFDLFANFRLDYDKF